jgi:hypothetical protein
MGVACRPRRPGPVVNEVLLTAGVAAILIAIVGGGAKAFGFDVPVLQSGRRQVALGLVGVVFLGAAVLLRDDGNGDGPDAAVQGYREEVLATCRALPRGQPAPTAGVRFEKDAYLDYLSAQRVSWQSSLAELWEQAAPDSLREDERAARAATARLLESWGVALARLDQQLPASFDLAAAAQYAQSAGSVLAAPATSWERAMSRLAGAACTPPATAGG